MFLWCELKPVAEKGSFHLVSPWDDSPLELALALILLQPTSFNTLNWWEDTFLWSGLVSWWIKSAYCMTRSAPGHWLQGSSPSTPWPAITSQQGRAPFSSILPNSSRSTAQLWCFLWPKASSNRLIGLERGKIHHHHHPAPESQIYSPPRAGAGCISL